MISQEEWDKACREFYEREQLRRKNAKCQTCFDCGFVQVGTSGDPADGNAPIHEPCEDCAP